MLQSKAKIIENIKITDGIYEMALYAPKIAENAQPGQFVHIKCTDSMEPFLRRPFSIHNKTQNSIEILYKTVGKGTEILASKKPDEILDILGPLGNGFKINPQNKTVILAGGGIGVAPLIFLAYEIKKNTDAKIYVVLGAKTGSSIVCTKEFSAMGAEVLLATEDGSLGKKGLLTEVLKNLMEKIGFNTPVYGCGPNAMLKEIAKTASNCQFSLEERMACGVGVCLGCAVKTKDGYKLACKDGPVFDAKEIIL